MVDNLGKAGFNRYLENGFVAALNTAYGGDGGWWRNLADDPDIFVAIRGGYLNAYYKGNSLMRLNVRHGKPCGDIHYKYLLKPTRKPEYVSVFDGKPAIENHADFFLSDLSDVASLKKAAARYAGDEKAGVHDIIKSNPNIIDVEIAFGTIGVDDRNATASRIDFAALQEDESAVHLTFFEAKHFTNSELRSSGDQPPVFAQLERYSNLLNTHADDVRAAYMRVCAYLRDMMGETLHNPVQDRLMQLVLSGEKPLKLNTAPRLVVFGFDADQRKGTAWTPHLQKLRDVMGDRLLCRGNAKGLTSGISKNMLATIEAIGSPAALG